MPDYTLSKAADRDLAEIYRHRFGESGEAQADACFDLLNDLLERLAANSRLGREIDPIRPGYRRHAYQRHFVYFRTRGGATAIVRVLES